MHPEPAPFPYANCYHSPIALIVRVWMHPLEHERAFHLSAPEDNYLYDLFNDYDTKMDEDPAKDPYPRLRAVQVDILQYITEPERAPTPDSGMSMAPSEPESESESESESVNRRAQLDEVFMWEATPEYAVTPLVHLWLDIENHFKDDTEIASPVELQEEVQTILT